MLHLWKKNLKKLAKSRNYWKVRDHSHYTVKYRGTEHTICNLRFDILNEILVVFHKDSNYDYHLIIKQLANESEGQFECLGENKKMQKAFSVPIKKESTKIDKDGNKSIKTYLTK